MNLLSIADLAAHADHDVELAAYPGDPNIYLECRTCREVLYKFMPEDFPDVSENSQCVSNLSH